MTCTHMLFYLMVHHYSVPVNRIDTVKAGIICPLTQLTLRYGYDVIPTGREIGHGAYGRVFEVDYQGTLCAAKEVHALFLEYAQDDARRKITTDFLTECQIWSTIHHPCVVQFLGMIPYNASLQL